MLFLTVYSHFGTGFLKQDTTAQFENLTLCPLIRNAVRNFVSNVNFALRRMIPYVLDLMSKVKVTRNMPIQAQREGRVTALCILNLGSTWGTVVKATLWLLCSHHARGNRPGPHYRRGWVGSVAGTNGYGQNNLPPPGFEPRTFQPLARIYTICVILAPLKMSSFTTNQYS